MGCTILLDKNVTMLSACNYVGCCFLQKEENGEVVSTLPASQTEFVQSGLGPGQEYEVSINIIKNDTRGPQTSKTIRTSEFLAELFSVRLLFGEN